MRADTSENRPERRGRAIVVGPARDDAERQRRAAFIDDAFGVQHRNGAAIVLDALSEGGMPSSIRTLYGGDGSGGPYRGATEPRASRPRSRQVTAQIDADILAEPALAGAEASFVAVSEMHWPSEDIWTLKGGLLLHAGVAPVEIARSGHLLDVPRMISGFFIRLVDAGLVLPILTDDPSPAVVDAMLRASLAQSIEWTGRISGSWLPALDHTMHWLQPANADILSVADAIELCAQVEQQHSGFAWLQAGRRLVVFYGPSERGRYYAHRSRRPPSDRLTARDAIERRIQQWVRVLEEREPSLDDFPAERLHVELDKPSSFAYVTRRILRVNQFALTEASVARPHAVPSAAPPGAQAAPEVRSAGREQAR